MRPIYHYASDRVRAHIFLCMLAYYVEWHMRARLKPLLFEDDDPDAAEAARTSVVAPAEVAIRQGQGPEQTDRRWVVHSFRTLLDDLATVAKNVCPTLSRSTSLPAPATVRGVQTPRRAPQTFPVALP